LCVFDIGRGTQLARLSVIPIARAPSPASWIAFASLPVDGVPGGEDRVIVAGVSLRGADVAPADLDREVPA
jgi:hypothetical protein